MPWTAARPWRFSRPKFPAGPCIAESASSHIVEDLLAFVREPRRPIGHNAGPLGRADRLTQIGLARLDVRAVWVFGHVERDNVIAGFDRSHTLADFFDDAAAFMA